MRLLDGSANTTLALLDDHDLFRRGFRMLLEGDLGFECIADGGSVEQLMRACEQDEREPNIVLLEVLTAAKTGLASLVGFCLEMHPEARILTYDRYGEQSAEVGAHIAEGLAAGTYGHVSDASKLETFTEAIRLVRNGKVVLDRQYQLMLMGLEDQAGGGTWTDATRSPRFLTKREIHVLSLVSAGATNREIAKQLECAESTVKNHLHTIFSKLGAASRGQAVAIAMKRRLL